MFIIFFNSKFNFSASDVYTKKLTVVTTLTKKIYLIEKVFPMVACCSSQKKRKIRCCVYWAELAIVTVTMSIFFCAKICICS